MKLTSVLATLLLCTGFLPAEPEKITGKMLGGKADTLVENEYAQAGEWTVHYYKTKDDGKFVQVSIIRFYGEGKMLRMTLDETNFFVDLAGDWKGVGGKGEGEPFKLFVSADNQEAIEESATIINDEGDKWLRLSQQLDEPSGLQDIIRNAKKFEVRFSAKDKWVFDLKGRHAAWQKADECEKKFKK